MNVAGLQLQSASTESFFMLPGHGSPPKTSGATDTEQDCFPMQFLWRASYDLWAWQLPSRKLPHVPCGTPKLANCILEIFRPGAHHKWALDCRLLTLLEPIICEFFRDGCPSKISAQTLSIVLFTRVIPAGLPPNSSSTINWFPLGFSQDRGTWYHLWEGPQQPVWHFLSLKIPA